MPLLSQSIIVGGGVEFVLPITVGQIPRVASVGPPGSLVNSVMRQWSDGAVDVITIGATDVRGGIGATETLRLRDGIISQGVAADSFVAGRGAAVGAAGVESIAIGLDALADGVSSVVVGGGGSFASTRGTVFGYGSFANVDGLAVGYNAFGGRRDVTIGASSFGADEAITIGQAAEASSAWDLVIGFQARTENSASPAGEGGAFALGTRAQTLGTAAFTLMAIGTDATAGAPGLFNPVNPFRLPIIAIGRDALALGNDLVIGHASESQTVSISNYNVLLGHDNITTGQRSIIIGHGLTTALSNVGFFGTPNTDIRTLIIGNGDTAVTPLARTVRFTNGSGVDNAAGAAAIVAPRSTGNAASAPLSLQVGVPAASSAVLQAVVDAARVSHTATAGQTMLEIFDVNTAGLARVLVGAAGTGPGGVGRALYLA